MKDALGHCSLRGRGVPRGELMPRRASVLQRGLWRNADFRNLWFGLTASLFGAKITAIAVPLIASRTLHATPLEMGSLVAMEYLPYLVTSLAAGVWLDRRSKLPLLILSDIARAGLLMTIPVAWFLDVLSVPLLLTLALLIGFCTVVSDIGSTAYLPSLVGRDQLIEGNSKLELSSSASNIGGNALGGVVLQLVSAPLTLLFNSAAYLLSAAFTFRIRHREPERQVHDQRPGMLQEVREGVQAVFGHPTIRRIVLATMIFNFFTFVIEPVLLLFLTRTLDLSAFSIGLVFSASGAGALTGALIAGRVSRRLGLGRTLVGSLLLAGLAALLIPAAVLVPSWSAPLMIVTVYFVNSVIVIVYNVNQRSLRAALTPYRLQGRMNASIRMVVMGVAPAGAFLGGALGTWLGTLPVLVLGAAGIILASCSLLLSHVRTVAALPVLTDAASSTRVPVRGRRDRTGR
ncbi:MFS transporter [Streptomyces ipomoeae]|uniref:MFS transporter n=1 Tax=Streptomyces ipomoeae TaxID=103232 RepID=A0AAE9AWE3_9ACTN|nr:MFS transporter [Streptomyces ipomoeae]MDX2821942.1 MFS transporter [Streptomyces ipomoeae]MDX2874637.1 MFS transporter [Streptomyces ipomoeae]TQE20604.1 MFS transporter [Streptomyces ipomoeae]TQE40021.1 MFS transporter [Streptomyces ipomoeae]